MKNKSMLTLLIAGLLILATVATACSNYMPPTDAPFLTPHNIDLGFSNCLVCHTGGEYPIPVDIYHPSGITNDTCISPICHPLLATYTTPPPTGTTTTLPPTGTTTTPPPTGTTTTPPPTGTTTTGVPPVLDLTAKQLEVAFHPEAYLTLCLICHGEGVGIQQYPLPPVWPGTNVTPGPWTIIPGSDQDHTGRTDVTQCISTGCHQMGQ